MFVNFKTIWSILLPFGMFYGHFVYFSRFGMLCKEKSGNPGGQASEAISCLDRFWFGFYFASAGARLD
jgi:hypothetical protein